jgi:hypothetical protein
MNEINLKNTFVVFTNKINEEQMDGYDGYRL